MKSFIHVILLLLLFAAHSMGFAGVPDSSKYVTSIVAGADEGYVLPHNEQVKQLLSDGKRATVALLGVQWQARAGKASEDDLRYGLPKFETGLLVSDFSTAPLHRLEGSVLFPKPSSIGQMIAPYASIYRPLARSRRFEFGYRIEQGLAVCTRPYDKIKNPENELIGGRFSIHVGLGFQAEYHITPEWAIGANANFHHYSNGRMDEPNIGVNVFDGGLRAVYTLNPDTTHQSPYRWRTLRRTHQLTHKKHFYLDLNASVMPRVLLCEWNYLWAYAPETDPRYRTGKFDYHNSASISAVMMYSYSPKYSSGIGLEYLYVPIGDDIYHWETLKGNLDVTVQSPHGLSTVIHHEARYKNLAAHLSFGIYMLREPRFPHDIDFPFYETAGVRYYLPFGDRRTYLGYNIRAHGLTADAFQFGVGYAIGK